MAQNKDFRESLVDFGVRFVKFVPGYSDIKNDLLADWKYAQSFTSVEQFIEKEHDLLKNISLGFNYSPPHMEWITTESRLKDPSIPVAPADVFNWLQEHALQLGRMEIRIDKSVSKELDFLPDFYTPWMQEFKKRKMKAILNPGLKAARWPEIHISDDILKKIYGADVPYKSRTIKSNDPLASYVLHYQQQVYSWLKESYFDTVFAVQPENEPNSRFGAYRWKLSDNSLYHSVANAIESFIGSNVRIMVNSPMVAGMMQKVATTLIEVAKQYPAEAHKLIVGVNHYYRHPHSFVFGTDDIGDTLAFSQLGSLLWGNVEQEKLRIADSGIKMMTTELQIEPWYPKWMTPGDNFNEFIFILLRNCQFLNINKGSKTPILLWGIEEMYVNSHLGLHKEQKMIMQAVTAINAIQ